MKINVWKCDHCGVKCREQNVLEVGVDCGSYQDPVEGTQTDTKYFDICPKCATLLIRVLCKIIDPKNVETALTNFLRK